jgi:hypothetical protein
MYVLYGEFTLVMPNAVPCQSAEQSMIDMVNSELNALYNPREVSNRQFRRKNQLS